MSKRLPVFLLLAALVLAGGCAQGRAHSREFFAMDTIMVLTAYGPGGEAAVEQAEAEIRRLDALLSTGSASSEVSQVNRAGEGRVSEDTEALARRALEIYEATEGAFDFTIYPLMELWGFSTGEYHVPTEEELAEVLPLVDASQVELKGGSVVLAPGQRIDFGGIAKGYASARVMEIFRENGVTSGMVSLGGNVQVLGGKPDGQPWRIGVQDPEAPQDTPLAVAEVRDRAVVTSGGYERYFGADGRTYIHILDPKTGYPMESDLASVTVVSEDGALADALSTALYVMGREGAADYWRKSGGDFDVILLGGEGEIFVSEGLREAFQTQLPLTVLRRSG